MNPFSALALFAFLVFTYFGLYVYLLDRTSPLNRRYAWSCTAFASWSLAYVFCHSAPSVEVYKAYLYIAMPGAVFAGPLFLHFVLTLAHSGWLARHAWMARLLYLPSAVILVAAFVLGSNIFADEIVRVPLGWYEVPAFSSPWYWILIGYDHMTALIGLVLTFAWGRRATIVRERRQARVMVLAMAPTLVVVAFDSLGWPGMSATPVPSIGWAPLLILMGGVYQAIVRHRLMALTPTAVAHEILQTMHEVVILVDARLEIVAANAPCQELIGLEAKDLVGRPLRDIFFEPTPKDEHLLAGLLELEGSVSHEMSCKTQAGNVVPVLMSVSVVGADVSDHEGAVVVLRDISESKRAEEQLRHLAHHDVLTGLTNRALFHDRLDQALERARRNQLHVALIYLDLDKFKPVNDTMGHEAGDDLLKIVAARLSRSVRKVDTVARLGGDEFAVILPDMAAPESWRIVEGRLRLALHEPAIVGGRSLNIGYSLGVSVFPADGRTGDELLRRADHVMYEAKRAGGSTGVARSSTSDLVVKL